MWKANAFCVQPEFIAFVALSRGLQLRPEEDKVENPHRPCCLLEGRSNCVLTTEADRVRRPGMELTVIELLLDVDPGSDRWQKRQGRQIRPS
jgi:hypothetical protein